jgi:hypothetical protein
VIPNNRLPFLGKYSIFWGKALSQKKKKIKNQKSGFFFTMFIFQAMH